MTCIHQTQLVCQAGIGGNVARQAAAASRLPQRIADDGESLGMPVRSAPTGLVNSAVINRAMAHPDWRLFGVRLLHRKATDRPASPRRSADNYF
jgi:hypothetical protein